MLSRQHHHTVNTHEAENDDDDILPDGHRRGQPAYRPNATQTGQTPSLPPSTAKRRKLVHLLPDIDAINNDEEFLSSSPPGPTAPQINELDDQTTQIQIPRSSPEIPYPEEPADPRSRHHTSGDLPLDDSDSNSPVKNIVTPKLKTSRFRHPPHFPSATPPTHPADQYQPFPSFQSRLLGATTSALRGPHPSLDFTLPDAFSPSRRRGQRAYIHGGHAEIVRSWVLDVAARAGDGRALAERGKKVEAVGLGEDLGVRRESAGRMNVDEILHQDWDGRCAIVRLSDLDDLTSPSQRPRPRSVRNGDEWMLINTDSQHTSRLNPPGSKLEMLRPGAEIMIKGGEAMRWRVDCGRTLVAGGTSSPGQGGRNSLVGLSSEAVDETSGSHVAVFWDVVQP